jgi:hypothetical protein
MIRSSERLSKNERLSKIAIALAACLWGSLAFGQANNSNTWETPGHETVGGMVQMAPNAAGQAVPVPPNTPPGIGIAGNAAGTVGAVVGTLAAAAGKTTYICGFNVQAIGGTAAVGPITVAGLIGSSQVYQGSSSAAGGTVASVAFTPCIPASAVNTAITITTTADGTATAVNVNSWGFQF